MSDDRVLLASGRDADVFAVDELRVLRHYRTGGDVKHEMAVMAHAAAHGYPVPIVYEGAGTDMTLQRLDGPTLLDALTDSGIDINAAAEHLVDLHQ